MIKKYSLLTLQKALNYALSLDKTSLERIVVLEGKVIEIVIEPLDIHFFITVNQRELQLLDEYENKRDTIIRSSPLGLIRLSFLPASKARSLFNDKIKLEGDIQAGQQLKTIIDDLDIDWETHIARFTGDVAAHQLGLWFKQGRAFKNRLSASMQQNTTDFLQEELRILPSREELNDFFNEVDQVAMAVERLQAKLNLLMSTP